MIFRRLSLASAALVAATLCLAETPEPKTAFLLERKVITTKTGVTALPPATRVEVVGRRGESLIVKANDQEFEVAPTEVTTDAQAAALVAQREEMQQQALEKEAAERELRYKESLLMRQKEEAEAAKARKTTDGGARDRELEKIRARRELLSGELDKINAEQQKLSHPNSSDRTQRKPAANSSSLRERRKEIERELLELKQREQSLRAKAR